MGSTTTIIATAAVAISRALESYGCDTRAVFVAAGLDPDKMHEPSARYPILPMRRVWQMAADASGDPCFGLTVAEFATPTSFHALGFSWLASHTLHEALTRLVRYHHIMSTGSSVALDRLEEEYRLMYAGKVLGSRFQAHARANVLELQHRRVRVHGARRGHHHDIARKFLEVIAKMHRALERDDVLLRRLHPEVS